MINLITYDNPTDIFIFGTVFDNEDFSFTTTDDYDEINFLNQANFVRGSLATDGSVGIYTKEELSTKYLENNKNLLKYIEDFKEEEDNYHFIYLPNYLGHINLVIEKHTGNGIFKPLSTEEFDINIGCYYQDVKNGNFNYDFCKVYLIFNLPNGATIRNIDRLKKLII